MKNILSKIKEETSTITLPNNLTVGGSLDLENTGVTSLPDNLTVGGSLCLKGTGITNLPNNLKREIPLLLQWRNLEYIKVDRIFSKVVSHHGNVYKIRQIGENKERYLITDGLGKWSHGNTLHEAKSDLIYKVSNHDKLRYESLTLDSCLKFEEAIECYQVITGACSTGTKMFVESNPEVKKEKYTISEIIKITEGQYNCLEFKRFFGKELVKK